MRVTAAVGDWADISQQNWANRWERSDQGLITAWVAGQEYARKNPDLVERARAGELPILPFRGGVEKAIKVGAKVGHLLYVAMWQGLRGDPLDLDTEGQIEMTCAKHRVTVVFTADLRTLLSSGGEE